MNEEKLFVSPENSGSRLDLFIASELEMSRSAVQKLIENGLVSAGGAVLRKSDKTRGGEEISVLIPEPETADILPQDIPLDIVYEDESLLVVNKPKGMVVHPAPGNPDKTLVNALMFHCGESLSGINGVIRPGIVHRIDKDTSGLLIVAKNDTSHILLSEQIKEHSFERQYRAVVVGHMPQLKGTVDKPIGRNKNDRKKQAVDGLSPRDAVTHYEVLEQLDGFDYAAFTLETGRTHQIRVHSAYLGHPVAGDTVYGGTKNTHGLDGQCLHAAVIGFVHPVTGEFMHFEAPLPRYFTEFLGKLRMKSGY